MKMKNDCQVDYIKDAFDKLYNRVMPYIDLTQFADADTAFKELDKKVHSEIYILKKCLAESDRAVDAGLTRSKVLQERIHELEGENASLRATTFDTIDEKEKEINDMKKKIQYLETELAQARNSTELLLRKENDRLRIVIDELEKEINALKKKIHELKTRNEILEKSNGILRLDNETLWSKLEECDIPTREQASYKSLVEAIEFQGKRIEELEAEKARLKEAYDIHETTTKKENVDLSPGHEFKFGDEVFVPWSYDPYMYIKSGQLYNPRTERLVYVGKDQHLKWFGEKFSIV